jgi:hypothetical protein
MAAKKALTFNLDEAEPPVVTKPKPTKAAPPEADDTERKQVGARIPMALYRKLKAHAALRGQTVQVAVEVAVTDYLSRHADSL